MPPLLPEYLNQPLQIIVEASSTDWLAVIAGGLFTLIGAFVGAYIGARGASRAAQQSNDEHFKRQGLVSISEAVFDVEQEISGRVASIALEAATKSDYRGERIKDVASTIDASLTLRLKNLVKTYEKSLEEPAVSLHNKTVLFSSLARREADSNLVWPEHPLIVASNEIQSELNIIKTQIELALNKR
ncbi:hypothetical protein [Vreelandella alkaliphila]|uniref:hypothetical protein n=1 Tax=Vreelandella alkaliphila TaxID=272774 RepID=UPI003FD7D8A7